MESKYLDSGWIPEHGVLKILGLRKTEKVKEKVGSHEKWYWGVHDKQSEGSLLRPGGLLH